MGKRPSPESVSAFNDIDMLAAWQGNVYNNATRQIGANVHSKKDSSAC